MKACCCDWLISNTSYLAIYHVTGATPPTTYTCPKSLNVPDEPDSTTYVYSVHFPVPSREVNHDTLEPSPRELLPCRRAYPVGNLAVNLTINIALTLAFVDRTNPPNPGTVGLPVVEICII